MQNLSSPTSDQTKHLQGKHCRLTTGPPGKSIYDYFLKLSKYVLNFIYEDSILSWKIFFFKECFLWYWKEDYLKGKND